MSTTNSTLEFFALKSYVSVLPETMKETALRIVGGDDWPPEIEDPTGYHIDDPAIQDWGDRDEDDPYVHFGVDEDGYITDWEIHEPEPIQGDDDDDDDDDDDGREEQLLAYGN